MATQSVKLKRGAIIGEINAEDDEHYLKKCFIERHEERQVSDIENNRSIILGRTGSGKTAILIKITERHSPCVINIDPNALFFEHIGNSQTFEFFTELGANLDSILAVLWKQLLLIEVLQTYFETQTKFENIISQFSGKANYLRDYLYSVSDENFWNSSEKAARALVTKTESSLEATAQVPLELIKLGAAGARKISREEQSKIIERIKPVIQTVANSKVNRAIQDFNEITKNKQKFFYVIVDELDENWIIEKFKYRIVRSLIETLKAFRKVRCVKIIIAMRNDLYERTILETANLGFQKEKYDGFLSKIEWSKPELRDLIEGRIGELFRWQYESKTVKFHDVFPLKIGQTDAFEYLILRTFFRPRDLIEFINEILSAHIDVSLFGGGNAKLSTKRIRDAEHVYSVNRLVSLYEEWSTVHPNLKHIVEAIRSINGSTPGRFQTNDNTIKERLLGAAIDIAAVEDATEFKHDSIYKLANQCFQTGTTDVQDRFTRHCLAVMYKVGVLAIKGSPERPYTHSARDLAIISDGQIRPTTKFAIHPMFYKALGVTPNQ